MSKGILRKTCSWRLPSGMISDHVVDDQSGVVVGTKSVRPRRLATQLRRHSGRVSSPHRSESDRSPPIIGADGASGD